MRFIYWPVGPKLLLVLYNLLLDTITISHLKVIVWIPNFQ